MRRIIFPILLLLLLVVSCASPELDNRLATIEQMMSEQPDSALSLLEEIDSKQINNRRQRAWYALLYSQALDKNFIDSTNDSIINIAVEYYEKHGDDAEHLFLAYYYKARIYENSGNQLAAMNMLTQAETLINLFENDRAKGLMYAQMGELYQNGYDYKKALQAYKNALYYYEKDKILPHTFYAKLNISEILIYTKKFDEALKYLTECKEWSYYNSISEYKKCLSLLSFLYQNTKNIDALENIIKDKHFNKDNINNILSAAYLAASQGDKEYSMTLINHAQSISYTLYDSINLNFYKYRILKQLGDYNQLFHITNNFFNYKTPSLVSRYNNLLLPFNAIFIRNRPSYKNYNWNTTYTFILLSLFLYSFLFFSPLSL